MKNKPNVLEMVYHVPVQYHDLSRGQRIYHDLRSDRRLDLKDGWNVPEKPFRCGFEVLEQSEEFLMFGNLDRFGIGIQVGLSIEIVVGFGICGAG